MAFNHGSNGSSRRPGRGNLAISEINVTPFVDVVLVLLIIFMLTAHVVEYGIDINVPKTQKVSHDTKDLPIVEISLRTGFKNQSHFTTLFRKYTNFTPKIWRELKLV